MLVQWLVPTACAHYSSLGEAAIEEGLGSARQAQLGFSPPSFFLARSQERVNRSSLTFAAAVSETAPSFSLPPSLLSFLPSTQSFPLLSTPLLGGNRGRIRSLPLFSLFRGGGMENQQNEPNFPIHLTRESFSSSFVVVGRSKNGD